MQGKLPPKGYQFGPFELDLNSGELRKYGLRIKLQDQPFKILVALLERPGEIVSREELRERIWGDGTFVDFDHGLSAAVNRLRDALGDSAENPRFVETMARRGYRFIAPLDGVPAPEMPAHPPAPVSTKRRGLWVSLAGVVVALLALGLWLVNRSPELPPARVVPLTSLPGFETAPSFSPDGNQVTFTWNGEKQDNMDVYVKALGSTTPLRLTTDAAQDVSPVWSPDGAHIAFLRVERGNMVGVYLISPLGGAERRLAGFRASGGVIAWHPGGDWLGLAEWESQETNRIAILNVKTGEKRRLITGHTGYSHSPAFSPDGRSLAYAACATPSSCDLRVLELAADLAPKGESRRLGVDKASITKVIWTADGWSLIYSAVLETVAYLWRVPLEGSAQPERLEIAGPFANWPAVARAANRLAYSKGAVDADILKWEPGGTVSEFVPSSLVESNPHFSPDGARVAFESSRAGGEREIWVCGRDGSKPVQLTSGLGRHQGSPAWSPDGQTIAFDSRGSDGRWDIYLIDAAGGQPRRLTTDPADESGPNFSRDGRWIYFASNRAGAFGYDIWRIPANGGEWVRITDKGGEFARESWDGKTIYYSKTGVSGWGPSSLFARSLAGGPETVVIESVISRAFYPVSDGIYYITAAKTAGDNMLMFMDFATRKSRQLTMLPKTRCLDLAVSPERNMVLFTFGKPMNYDLMLVENFR